jgi:hypothetical protein
MGRQLRLVDTPDTGREKPPDLRDAVKSSIDKMDWLADTDDGLKALALRHAEEIESAVERAELLDELYRDAAGDGSIYKKLQRLEAMCDIAKTVQALGPQLQATLRDLGGSPATRAEIREALKGDKPVKGRLAQLRGDADRRQG